MLKWVNRLLMVCGVLTIIVKAGKVFKLCEDTPQPENYNPQRFHDFSHH